GHSLIVVALVAIISDNAVAPARLRDLWLVPAAYAASLALFFGAYFAIHAELFGTAILLRVLLDILHILLDVDHEPHLGMYSAQHFKISQRRECDVGSAPRLLVA